MGNYKAAVDVRASRATKKYELAMVYKGAPRRWDGQVATQVKHYREYRNHVFPLDFRVRELLAAAGAPRVHVFAYLRFGRQVDKVNRNETGEARLGHALLLLRQNEARGLARELLLRVCREVFDIDPLRYNPSDPGGVSAEVSRPSDGVGPAPDSGSDQSQAARD